MNTVGHSGLVSVMMPAFNAADYIAQAVESVLAQTYPNWELLVVNDGSSDQTAEIVAKFRDPRIRLLNKQNGGESSARNVALEHSRGQFIAYLDSDDAYLPTHLESTVAYLKANPGRDAVYTDGFYIDGHNRRLASLQSRRRGPFEGRIFDETVLSSDVIGAPLSVVLRHDLVARHRIRYDERIVIGPDWDFFTRYADLASFGFLPEPTGLYRVHASNITTQVDDAKRRESLAICRETAIDLESFRDCPVRIRSAVFFDLLVNLTDGRPEQQTAAINGPRFGELPLAEQGRLLRLMASRAILAGDWGPHVRDWLSRSRHACPGDMRTAGVAMLFGRSPRICRLLLEIRTRAAGNKRRVGPFADLVGANN